MILAQKRNLRGRAIHVLAKEQGLVADFRRFDPEFVSATIEFLAFQTRNIVTHATSTPTSKYPIPMTSASNYEDLDSILETHPSTRLIFHCTKPHVPSSHNKRHPHTRSVNITHQTLRGGPTARINHRQSNQSPLRPPSSSRLPSPPSS